MSVVSKLDRKKIVDQPEVVKYAIVFIELVQQLPTFIKVGGFGFGPSLEATFDLIIENVLVTG